MGLVRACSAMLPRLQAEESMLAMTRVAMGTASVEKEARRSILHDWQEAATPGRTVTRVTPSPDQLRGIGIGVHAVKKTKQ